MKRILRIILGLLLVAAAGTAYHFVMDASLGLPPDKSRAVAEIILVASLAAGILFLVGETFGIRGHAYYMICCGAVFLAADLMFSFSLGIRLAIKPSQHGFMPFSIVGVFLGPLYRMLTMTSAPLPRDPHA